VAAKASTSTDDLATAVGKGKKAPGKKDKKEKKDESDTE